MKTTKKLTQEEFVLRISKSNPHLVIVGVYKNHITKVTVRCTKDEYEWEAMPQVLIRNSNVCPCCNNRVVVSGVNDIATTHPHIAKCMKNVNDITIYYKGSNKSVEFLC